jgi:predicted GIY-YIG superfamily endonuclease
MERFGADFFRGLPEQPGVYLMCARRDGVLYVGKAKNLRRRLGSYRSANPERLSPKIRRLLFRVERIYWDACTDEASAIERERTLLRTLRPKFNTIGTYPAPKHHLGWRRIAGALVLGFGDATDGWENRFGEFPQLHLCYAALARLLWSALQGRTSVNEMPSALLRVRPPSVWLFPHRGAVGELEPGLSDFLGGQSSELIDRLLQLAPPASRFDEQWREQDAVCLREFYERMPAG